MRHTGAMATHRTARARARAEITAEIIDEARRQLAAEGAAALSLRSIARELGMVSSAIYRYVDSRDDLLTRLIIEAYDSLGGTAEAAVAGKRRPTRRRALGRHRAGRSASGRSPARTSTCSLYGRRCRDTRHPTTPWRPGTRVTLALLSIVRDAADGGRLRSPAHAVARPTQLADDLDRLADDRRARRARSSTCVAVLAAWTQLFGLLSFELSNQTRGVVEDHAALLAATARLGALSIGLTDRSAAA